MDADKFKTWMEQTCKTLSSHFSQHPNKNGESYLQHLCVALGLSSRCVYAAFALAVHGLFPFLMTRTGSIQIERLAGIVHSRMAKTSPHNGN